MMLYGMDVTGQRADWALARFWFHFLEQDLDPPPPWARPEAEGPRLQLDAGAKSYAEKIVRGVETHRDAIDARIIEASKKWRLERMALVERNLLRLGAYELAYEKTIPPRVVMNEAIELAKVYGAAEAKAFVNGVLDRVGKAGADAL